MYFRLERQLTQHLVEAAFRQKQAMTYTGPMVDVRWGRSDCVNEISECLAVPQSVGAMATGRRNSMPLPAEPDLTNI